MLSRVVGVSNETKVVVNGQQLNALIDTGSMVTTISESAYDLLGDKPELQSLNSLGLKLSMADGSKLSYTGYIEATISIPTINAIHLDFNVPVLVIKNNEFNSECPVIIGTNVIRQISDTTCSNDIPQEWKNARTSLQLSSFSAKISAKRPFTIGPYETLSVKCFAKGVNSNISQVVTENIGSESQNYTVCPRVIKLQQR